jgi:hypothetical protein
VRDERQLPRVGSIEVDLAPGFAAADQVRAQTCLAAFQNYCAVTESVRAGIGVRVTVADAAGGGPNGLLRAALRRTGGIRYNRKDFLNSLSLVARRPSTEWRPLGFDGRQATDY